LPDALTALPCDASPTASLGARFCGSNCLHRARRGFHSEMRQSRAPRLLARLFRIFRFKSKSLICAHQQRLATGCCHRRRAQIVFTLGIAECCTPGAKLTSRQYPKLPRYHRKRAVASTQRRYAPPALLSHCVQCKVIEITGVAQASVPKSMAAVLCSSTILVQ